MLTKKMVAVSSVFAMRFLTIEAKLVAFDHANYNQLANISLISIFYEQSYEDRTTQTFLKHTLFNIFNGDVHDSKSAVLKTRKSLNLSAFSPFMFFCNDLTDANYKLILVSRLLIVVFFNSSSLERISITLWNNHFLPLYCKIIQPSVEQLMHGISLIDTNISKDKFQMVYMNEIKLIYDTFSWTDCIKLLQVRVEQSFVDNFTSNLLLSNPLSDYKPKFRALIWRTSQEAFVLNCLRNAQPKFLPASLNAISMLNWKCIVESIPGLSAEIKLLLKFFFSFLFGISSKGDVGDLEHAYQWMIAFLYATIMSFSKDFIEEFFKNRILGKQFAFALLSYLNRHYTPEIQKQTDTWIETKSCSNAVHKKVLQVLLLLMNKVKKHYK